MRRGSAAVAAILLFVLAVEAAQAQRAPDYSSTLVTGSALSVRLSVAIR